MGGLGGLGGCGCIVTEGGLLDALRLALARLVDGMRDAILEATIVVVVSKPCIDTFGSMAVEGV